MSRQAEQGLTKKKKRMHRNKAWCFRNKGCMAKPAQTERSRLPCSAEFTGKSTEFYLV